MGDIEDDRCGGGEGDDPGRMGQPVQPTQLCSTDPRTQRRPGCGGENAKVLSREVFRPKARCVGGGWRMGTVRANSGPGTQPAQPGVWNPEHFCGKRWPAGKEGPNCVPRCPPEPKTRQARSEAVGHRGRNGGTNSGLIVFLGVLTSGGTTHICTQKYQRKKYQDPLFECLQNPKHEPGVVLSGRATATGGKESHVFLQLLRCHYRFSCTQDRRFGVAPI